MSEERRCQLKALLNEQWGRQQAPSPKRKPRRSSVGAFTTEIPSKEISMKTVREPSKKVKQVTEPTLYGAKVSDLTEDDHNEIKRIILKAMVRKMFPDLRAPAKQPKVRHGFQVIDGGLCA